MSYAFSTYEKRSQRHAEKQNGAVMWLRIDSTVKGLLQLEAEAEEIPLTLYIKRVLTAHIEAKLRDAA